MWSKFYFQIMFILYIILKGMTNAAICKHILCPYTQPRHLGGVKGQNIFMKVVMLHIKLNGMEHSPSYKHIFYPTTHPRPLGWGQKIKVLFLITKVLCHVAYQIKGNGA